MNNDFFPKLGRHLLGAIGLGWVFFCLVCVAITIRVWRHLIDMFGWEVHESRIQLLPKLCSVVSWLGYRFLGGCELELVIDEATKQKLATPGILVALCDHPNRSVETPIPWIATWRIWDYMVGTFSSSHLKWWNPFGMGMWYTDMAVPIERDHKSGHGKTHLADAMRAKLAREAEERLMKRLTFFDRLAGKIGMVLVLHLFVNSRWTEERHRDDIVKYRVHYPDIVNWGKWVLMPQAGGLWACRRALTNVSGWYMMAVPKNRERGDDNWHDYDDVIGAKYICTIVDVTEEVAKLPLTREATAEWLGKRFAPWAAERHESALES